MWRGERVDDLTKDGQYRWRENVSGPVGCLTEHVAGSGIHTKEVLVIQGL